MSTTYRCLGTLALLLLGLGVARAQDPVPGYREPAPPAGPPPTVGPGIPAVGEPRPPAGLSSWILGTCEDCCGPLGHHHPMRTELFVRTGFSYPFGDSELADALDSGWAVQGGFRQLFFNDPGDAAWVVEASLLNIRNDTETARRVNLRDFPANRDLGFGQTTPVTETLVDAEIGPFNRTWVSLGAGREWYLEGSAAGTRTNDCARWRAGWDVGGRWGTSKLELVNIRGVPDPDLEGDFAARSHLTDVLYGVYAALHTDYEFPCGGCCIFYGGVRAEFDYTWTDILQEQNYADLAGVNLLFTVGVRY
jgi:hypothetical protein